MPLTRRDVLRAGAGGVLAATLPRQAEARIPQARLRELRSQVRGRVMAPGDSGYDAARLVFNRRFDAIRPPAVVRVRDAADVQAVVRWAGRHDVPLVVRSGGNAYNGASTSGAAVVLDVGGLDRFALAGDGVATVGPGLRNFPLYRKLARRGLVVASGSCPNIAIGGLATGGGMGLAGRALGLTLDRVTAFEVVTADGERDRVQAGSSLFWALRGGGGSFAVVTAVQLRTRRLRRAAWFFAAFPENARAEALAVWDDIAPGAPPALTSICTLTASGAGAFGQFLGPETALRRLVAPLARIGGVRFSAGTGEFLDLQRRWAGCAEGGCGSVPRSSFDAASLYVARRLSARARRAFLAAADGGATLILDAYGGAINAVPADATAFVHRDARFSVQILAYGPPGVARRRVRRAHALIAPFGNGEAYQNYADLALRSPRSAYYGANLERLRAVKRAVDPEGRFAPAQGVR